jgi:hypothetical protein
MKHKQVEMLLVVAITRQGKKEEDTHTLMPLPPILSTVIPTPIMTIMDITHPKEQQQKQQLPLMSHYPFRKVDIK